MMTMSAGTALALSLASTAVGTAVSAIGSAQQAKGQKAAANYQAAIAERNQEIAEEQASSQRRAGYEDMVRERQKTALVVSAQRAKQGASGAVVDTGSALDTNLDTSETGERNALAKYQSSLDSAWNTEIQAWNYGQNAQAYKTKANAISPGAAATTTLIGGLAQMGSAWAGYGAGGSDAGGATSGKYWDRALNQYVSSPVRH